jgi:hypothetical protein
MLLAPTIDATRSRMCATTMDPHNQGLIGVPSFSIKAVDVWRRISRKDIAGVSGGIGRWTTSTFRASVFSRERMRTIGGSVEAMMDEGITVAPAPAATSARVTA